MVSAKPGRQSAWRALDRRAREVVLRRTAPELVPSCVFAKEYERAAKLSALGNAVDHAIEWVELSPGSRAAMGAARSRANPPSSNRAKSP